MTIYSDRSIDPCILSGPWIPRFLSGPWITIFGPVHGFLYSDRSMDPPFPEKCLVQTKSRFESGFSLDKIRFYFSKLSRLNPDFFWTRFKWTQSGYFFKIKIKFVQNPDSNLDFVLTRQFPEKKLVKKTR